MLIFGMFLVNLDFLDLNGYAGMLMISLMSFVEEWKMKPILYIDDIKERNREREKGGRGGGGRG